MPMVPMYGGFPVKLRTHVGQPIRPADFSNVQDLRAAVVKVTQLF
jgi:hypothetical protein